MDWAVILAGGAGTRFWPLSTRRTPKQLLPLAGPVPSAVTTLAAIEPLVPRSRILVITGADLAGPLRETLALPEDQLLIEPRPASTGPALAWATTTALARDPSATVVSLHADWHLADPEAFRRAAAAALLGARAHDALIAVGVAPTRPETGYGYIVPGESLGGGIHRVRTFREKPDRAAAEALMAGGALWNSGLFAWTATRFLAELRSCAPEVSGALERLDAGDVPGFFAAVTPVSVDVSVLERSPRVLTLRGEFPWDDVGNWEALFRIRARDPGGNVGVGRVHPVESTGCVAWTDGPPVVLAGVRDLVVVHANGRVLVMDRGRAAELKTILERLPPEIRELP